MSLRIARMRIRLPAPCAARAADIARAAAQALARVPLARGASDAAVAAAVAHSLRAALKEKR